MSSLSFYDTKPYDQEYFGAQAESAGLRVKFHTFRLETDTARTAEGSRGVCVFVNDRLDRPCLATLSGLGVEFVALRCAGYNNVDLGAARDLGLAVVRVPEYSPYAVAEHTVALLLS